MAMGVPVGVVVPMLPEMAAAFVAERSGTRIDAVPRLVMRPYPFSGIAAVWHFDLESPVTVRGDVSQTMRTLSTVITGHLDGWGRPLLVAGQPEDSRVDEVLIAGPSGPPLQYRFIRRPDVPRALEPVRRVPMD